MKTYYTYECIARDQFNTLYTIRIGSYELFKKDKLINEFYEVIRRNAVTPKTLCLKIEKLTCDYLKERPNIETNTTIEETNRKVFSQNNTLKTK